MMEPTTIAGALVGCVLNKIFPGWLITIMLVVLLGLTARRTLLKGVNDQPEHAAEMIELLRDIPCKINLIPFNPFPHSGYERPSNNAIRRFQDMLHQAGYNVTVRTTRGEDIDAACGQLVGQVMDRTRRSERYIAVRQLATDATETAPSETRHTAG